MMGNLSSTGDGDGILTPWECSDRPESVRNRKYGKFLIDMVCRKNFQLRQKIFLSLIKSQSDKKSAI